jgi:hypothetical protein
MYRTMNCHTIPSQMPISFVTLSPDMPLMYMLSNRKECKSVGIVRSVNA